MPPQGPPCDCARVPAGLALDCQVINEAWRLLGGENGAGPEPSPPAPTALAAFPQPFRLEHVQIEPCDEEDPDVRPFYLWECFCDD